MLSFDLTDEQKMIRETVAAFALEQMRPAARLADETGSVPAALASKAWELGLIRGAIPEQFGGYGDARSAVTGAIVVEELAFGDLAFALHALAPRLLAFPVLEMGTDDQRARILKRFGGDDFAVGTAALMEPTFDFDPAALATTAVPVAGGGFVISGTKCCVPLADSADTILVYAASGRDAGFADVSAYLVPRNASGLTISVREQQMGIKALETFELIFDNCYVGGETLLGGQKAINFTRLLSESRVALGAAAVGVGRAAFDYSRAYAKERKAFGAPIATKQAVAFMLAEMATEIDATRLLVWEAASRLDKGDDALKESYQARNYAAQSALAVADNAVQILGGHGYIREHPVEMWLRNARGFAIFEGIATV